MIDESRGPALLILALFLSVAAWTFSNPPGAAPDEAAHYIRAASVSNGDLLPAKSPEKFPGGASTRSVRWMLKQAKLVLLPAQLSPESFRCRGIPGRIAPCEPGPAGGNPFIEELTYVGTYPPTPYLLPALFMKAASGSDDALYLARSASALVCWVLLALGVAALWDRRQGWLSLAGITIAISPMVIYLASSLSGSGLETAAAICFLACLLRLTRLEARGKLEDAAVRGPLRHPTWVWAAAAFSGALLATARDLGVVWLSLHLAIFVAWIGIRPAWAAVRTGGRGAWLACSVVLASMAGGLLWQGSVQVRPPFRLGDFLDQMRPSFGFFLSAARQQIGVFGPLDTVMPVIAYVAWICLALALFALAVLAADRQKMLLLLATTAAALGVTVALDAVQRTVGFGVQGRYLLPLAVAVPIVAGEIVVQGKRRLGWLGGRLANSGAAGVAGGVLFLGWYTIGRRYSVGLRGPLFFLEEAAWHPPLGWAAWGSLAALGALLIVLAAAVSPSRTLDTG